MFVEWITELTFDALIFEMQAVKVYMEKIIKTKYGYCHFDNDKIVITNALKNVDLMADYTKSINDFFKTGMAFFIFIPNIYIAFSDILLQRKLWIINLCRSICTV